VTAKQKVYPSWYFRFTRIKVEKQRRTSVSRKAAKHAKRGNDGRLEKAVGIAKTLDQVPVIHVVDFCVPFL
jgi:hypothetical protein